MWFLMIATYVAARPSLRRHDRQRQSNDERRLLATLAMMMTVFTIWYCTNCDSTRDKCQFVLS